MLDYNYGFEQGVYRVIREVNDREFDAGFVGLWAFGSNSLALSLDRDSEKKYKLGDPVGYSFENSVQIYKPLSELTDDDFRQEDFILFSDRLDFFEGIKSASDAWYSWKIDSGR